MRVIMGQYLPLSETIRRTWAGALGKSGVACVSHVHSGEGLEPLQNLCSRTAATPLPPRAPAHVRLGRCEMLIYRMNSSRRRVVHVISEACDCIAVCISLSIKFRVTQPTPLGLSARISLLNASYMRVTVWLAVIQVS